MTFIPNLPFRFSRRVLFAAITAFSMNAASAHSVWIETLEGRLLVRFGEVGTEYEKSPGYLDQLELPKVADTKDGKITVEKGADFFLLKDAKPAEASVISTKFPVMEKPATEKKPASARWPQFYARWQVAGAAVTPVSVLDIVPAAEGGKATVYFKGKPLPEAELTLIKPDGKEVDLKADAEGVVKFTAEGKGLFVLSVAGYSETANGTYEGKNYTVISHNSSLAWNQ
ncbi:hypothetical protein JIN84_07730 [Luteolibacter yonseiensis]|uniref:DUF4198 domain-containing protein n=1 Tax=Luteolibacter yonseiensis TaxID=1144680 RepID=A0A934VBJ8_9BACT|nr:hypothetical protein [Luteolibacter yonseiensis]MBK1815499.1 hypothetical protein [Luteolibacter yonseiensis]